MTERPILFSAPVARAILEGRKTQTRRVVKPQPSRIGVLGPIANERTIACPFGQPRDRLWVRESFVPRYFDDGKPAYKADWDGKCADIVPKPKWKPSIHMPRTLSRITLEVVSVRVERLQDISEDDAKAEGVLAPDDEYGGFDAPHRVSFMNIWDSINGPVAWASNPWVWVMQWQPVVTK